jgi:hypothetical protein
MKRKPQFHERRVMAKYESRLDGLSHTQLNRQRGLKGSTLGPASEGRKLSAEEIAAIEEAMRREGKL